MKILQGIDIVSVDRIKEVIERHGNRMLSRVFTPSERKYCESKRMKYEHYASRFAAKEAFIKAVPHKRAIKIDFNVIEVKRHPTGKPYIALNDSEKIFMLPKNSQVELSMAHERAYAVATVTVIAP